MHELAQCIRIWTKQTRDDEFAEKSTGMEATILARGYGLVKTMRKEKP